MSFSNKIQALVEYQRALEVLSQLTPVQELALGCLRHLRCCSADFEQYVSADSPFLKEFWITVKAREASADACFSLLECMATFFREKSLCCAWENLADVEKSLLLYFERSGQWRETDTTLVSEWYWGELPRRHAASA